MKRSAVRWLGVALVALLVCAGAAYAAFPADPPNDPDYDASGLQCEQSGVNSVQYYLYAKKQACSTVKAVDPEAAGMSVDAAWKQFTAGRPDTTIAYIEGGINWFDGDVKDLADQMYLNKGELPLPEHADGSTCAAYDCNGDGKLSVADYAPDWTDAAKATHDPRVKDSNGNKIIDPEDLIVAFSNGKDDDGNGYTDDISGWDFYDHQNDPATTDGAYQHANNQQRQAAAEADNNFEGAGVCPKCTILPVKAGAEALDRTDDLAQAWLYAGDLGASVIVSVTADLGYSTFMKQAIDNLWKRNVVMVEASNDFDSTDHQGGMFHQHVIPGNGLVTNTQGFPTEGLTNPLTTTYRARSGQTSWGTHNFTSVSTQGGSTSTSTPTHGGVEALVLSEGKDAADQHKIASPLTNAEAEQVVRATATDIDSPDSNWPSKPGFDLQFGYGRPNVLKAMQAVNDGNIPPVGWIDSPDWYQLFDPTVTKTVPVTGHVEARRSSGYHWDLQFAPGAEPSDADFQSAGTGAGTAPQDTTLGTLDLSKVPESFWSKAFTLSKTKTLETNEQYTVTLRLRVTDAQGRVGEDRRTIAVAHDPSWAPGYPKRIGPGGEAQAQLADLQGTGHLAIVFGDSDGVIHAIDGDSGKELPGWPVTTDATQVVKAHDGVDPGHEPVVSSLAIGDLDHTGNLSVVATSSTGKVYVFDAHGKRRAGWPKALDTGTVTPPIPRTEQDFTRLPHLGATAPPVLEDLNGDGKPEIVQSGWDGRIHAFEADGSELPGWPVEVKVPANLTPGSGYLRINDHKLINPPAIADLNGDGKPELIQRSQYSDVEGPDIKPLSRNYLFAYHADGTPVAGFPVKMQGLFAYYGSAQEFITEGSEGVSTADVNGDGKDEIAAGPIFSQTYLYKGDGTQAGVYGPVPDATLGILAGAASGSLPVLEDIIGGRVPTDAPVTFTASGAFGKVGGGALTYTQPGSGAISIIGALLVTGSGLPVNNYMRAYDARSAVPTAGFPAQAQGLDFLGGPSIADVTGDGKAEVLEGGDSSALHAFGAGGAQAAGFPKFTTGWMLYAPTVGDIASDGKSDVVGLTREGYLFRWKTPGTYAGNQEWWSYRHDEHNTGRYGADTRPPGAVRDLALHGTNATFTAPGDDWYDGTATRYLVSTDTTPATAAAARARHARGRASAHARAATTHTEAKVGGPAGTHETLDVPEGTTSVTVQAQDDAGNLGTPETAAAAAVTPTFAGKTTPAKPKPTHKPKHNAAPAPANHVSHAGGGTLPFTGLVLGPLALLAVALLGGGLWLRRRAAV